MHRVRPALRAAVLASLLAAQAGAQPAPAPLSCEPIERELSAAKSALSAAQKELDNANERAQVLDSLRAELERRTQELAARQADVLSCQSAQDNLCSATGAFVHGLAEGRVQNGGLGQCIAPADQRLLVEQLSGVTNVSAVLAQLGAFSAGESDVRPRLGPTSGSKLEKIAARLFAAGNNSPLVYRRLLLEALELMVPKSWAKIRQKPGNVDRWFASTDPLDESILAEARAGAASTSSSNRQAPLTSALQLVTAYELLADCRGGVAARDCGRAEQLRQALETSGPLVARRRVQDVWSSECSNLTPTEILDWLSDLPRSDESEAQTDAVAVAVQSKLLTCFLRDRSAGRSFAAWVDTKLPRSSDLTTRTLTRLLELESSWKVDSATDRCAQAVRALQTIAAPSECRLPPRFVEAVEPWARLPAPATDGASYGAAVCDRFARALWAGESASIAEAFSAVPTVDDSVRLLPDAPATNMARLRGLCEERLGEGDAFARAVRDMGRLAAALGEKPGLAPWFVAADGQEPLEDARGVRAHGVGPWLRSLSNDEAACSILELSDARCAACREVPGDASYDCAKLREIEAVWSDNTRRAMGFGALGVVLVSLLVWAFRLRRALRMHGAWLAQAKTYVVSVGLEPISQWTRWLFPSSLGRLEVALPKTAAWQRWGERAALVRSEGTTLQERDVNRAAFTAQRFDAHLALLVHDENVSPDLSAVRAMLEWAARGNKAVQVLPVPWSRLKWSQGAADLLELAEESSLRSNPFELRGRVTTSSQFFDRERLVSGLLASAQAGQFTVVTGLRRFGKSSLALEVARRLPGPSAYVDLAGFHHEIRHSRDPSGAADAILRFLCLQLLQSARSRVQAPLSLAVPEGKLDAATLTAWFRELGHALSSAGPGKSAPPVLLILDEIEQAIGAAEELDHALEVFAILVGRLRTCLPGSSQDGAHRIGVLFCSALHPLLWSPLSTLAHQSLIGSFHYVAVTSLREDAAASMMRGLGARQGIRFTDAALSLLIRESQGVPLLLRRLGTAVLELYDPERAHQGALGAVEIGVEGVRAALEREEAEGSPLRVWIESEIAEAKSPGGAVLRALARSERLEASVLREIAARAFLTQFEITGVALHLSAEESLRRAQEAAAVVVRLLGDSGLLTAFGDPTEPDGYELGSGVIRRVLSACPSVRRAP